MTFRTRFAPSPTGPLHLGHAFSALTAWDMAQANNGDFLLRIEDIDQSRARPAWEAQIYDDLKWLGLCWPDPVMRQSERQAAYDAALDRLWDDGQLYACTCTRRDVQDAMSAPQEGVPQFGPDGMIYPGTCRDKDHCLTKEGGRPRNTTVRLNMRRALELATRLRSATDLPDHAAFLETGCGPDGQTGAFGFAGAALIKTVGDVVLARKDMGTSYHLSVVVDDAAQEITHVVRGQDLYEATQIHLLLQALLGLPTPTYHHHRLIRDAQGKRLAKRDDARAISLYRAEGATPEDIRAMVGL